MTSNLCNCARVVNRRVDIFTTSADAMVNPVNTVGVMGAGLALEVKKRLPEVFEAYRKACRDGRCAVGVPFTHILTTPDAPFKAIINLPTKRHWRDPARLDDVAAGLEAIPDVIEESGFRTLAMPWVGCGLGGLSRESVGPLITGMAGRCPGTLITICEK